MNNKVNEELENVIKAFETNKKQSDCSIVWVSSSYYKPQGFCVTPKEIKKICGKAFGRKDGCTFWRDGEGYFYFAYTADMPNKRNKAEYEKFHDREDAKLVTIFSGVYHKHTTCWYLPDELERAIAEAKANTSSYARDVEVDVHKVGFRKLKPDDRKVICRLPYFDIESLYCGEDKPFQRPLLFLCRDWYKLCDEVWCQDWRFEEFLMMMYKLWLEKRVKLNEGQRKET